MSDSLTAVEYVVLAEVMVPPATTPRCGLPPPTQNVVSFDWIREARGEGVVELVLTEAVTRCVLTSDSLDRDVT